MGGPDVSVTGVLATNFDASLTEAEQQRRRNIVATVTTRFVRACNEDERRRPRDDKKTYMRDLARLRVRAPLRDLEATGDEVGSDVPQPRSFVLATSALREALRRLAASIQWPR